MPKPSIEVPKQSRVPVLPDDEREACERHGLAAASPRAVGHRWREVAEVGARDA